MRVLPSIQSGRSSELVVCCGVQWDLGGVQTVRHAEAPAAGSSVDLDGFSSAPVGTRGTFVLLWSFPSRSLWTSRVPLRRVRSIRSQLRAQGLLADILKKHHPDAFNRRYAQCFPPGTPSLRLGRSSERLYNFMDVRNRSPFETLCQQVALEGHWALGAFKTRPCVCVSGSVLRRHQSGVSAAELLGGV